MKYASILGLCLLAICADQAAGGETTVTPEAGLQGEALARLFKPVPGKSVIYLVRDQGDVWTLDVPVRLDGRPMGSTAPLTYFRWEVEPGRHVLISDTTPPAVLEIATEPGGIYYVWQDINAGLQRAPSRLVQVDHTTARATIETAILLESRP
jgi:hypothetical protein